MLIEPQEKGKASPQEIIKDPYVLELLGAGRPTAFSENDLESAIISNLQEFLLEMGKGFSFVGRQYHMRTDSKTIGIILCAEKDHALVKYSVLDELILPAPEELKAELEREIHFLKENNK